MAGQALAKPLLIFTGNCQAQHLGAIVRASGVAEAVFLGADWGFMPSYRGRVCRFLHKDRAESELAAEKAAGRRLILVSQASPLAKRAPSALAFERTDRQVEFPALSFWAMAPHRFKARYHADPEPARVLELDFDSARRCQDKAKFPVDVAGFIEREIRSRSLFHTVNHPSGPVLARLVEGLAEQLRDELDGGALLEAAKDVEGREGLNFLTDHPVSADLRRQLGLDWDGSYDVYAGMLTAIRQKRWQDLETLLAGDAAQFSEDTQFWRGRCQLAEARSDDAVALPSLQKLLSLCPGVPGPWLLQARYLVRRKRPDEALALLPRAKEFFEGAPTFHAIAVRILLMLRDMPAAEAHAREIWTQSSDSIDAVFPLIDVLYRRKKSAEVESLVASLRARPPNEQQALDNYLKRRGSERRPNFEPVEGYES